MYFVFGWGCKGQAGVFARYMSCGGGDLGSALVLHFRSKLSSFLFKTFGEEDSKNLDSFNF